MANHSKTIGNFLNPVRTGGDYGSEGTSPTLNPSYVNLFLFFFSSTLVARYPHVIHLDEIPTSEIETLAQFSIVCTAVAMKAWEGAVGSSQRQAA